MSRRADPGRSSGRAAGDRWRGWRQWLRRALVTAAVLPFAGALPARKGSVRLAASATPVGEPPLAFAIYAPDVDQRPATIEAIRADNNTPVAEVRVPGNPVALAVTPDSRFVLAVVNDPANAETHAEVIAVDRRNFDSRVALNVASNPQSIAVTPDGTAAYVIGDSGVTPVRIDEVTDQKNQVAIHLSKGPLPAIGPQSALAAVALSPDGKTLYLANKLGLLSAVSLGGGAKTTTAKIAGNADRIVISPDGATAFISFRDGTGTGSVAAVAVNGPTAVSQLHLPAGVDPTALAIATSPSGSSTLYIGDGNKMNLVPVPISSRNGAPGTPGKPIPLPSVPDAIASLPDGSRLEVSTFRGAVTDVDTAAGVANTCQVRSKPCPLGAGSIVITPDQAPKAAFTATPLPTGRPSLFDASGSSINSGKITGYRWDFGDGSTTTTTVPLAQHVYATPGTYTVRLTETDSAGSSAGTSPPSAVFTGQVLSRRGDASAQATRDLLIPSGSDPTITISPTVGLPGSVVTVSGQNFPHTHTITLAWLSGLGSTQVTTDSLGSFSNAVIYIFPRDEPSPRTLVALGFEKTANASFLVEAPPVEPGGRDLQLLFRR